MIKLVKTKKKKNKKNVYKYKEYTISYSDHVGYFKWNIYKGTNLSNSSFNLEGIKKIFADYEKVKQEGGWLCPKGCLIDHVVTDYSEVVSGINKHNLTDQELCDQYDSEQMDSDGYERDSDARCPYCDEQVKWYKPENSVKFIKEM